MKDKVKLGLQTREANVAIIDEENRKIRLVWSTGARRRTFSFEEFDVVDEELSLDPAHVRMERINSGALPLLDSHRRNSMEDQIGVIESGEVDGKEGRAIARFAKDDERADKIWNKVRQGIVKNLSVGYSVHKFEITKEEGKRTLYRAVDWEPSEISTVPVGADPGAQIRSESNQIETECVLVTRGQEEAPIEETMKNPKGTTKKVAASQTPQEPAKTAPEVIQEAENRSLEDQLHLREIADALGYEGELSLEAIKASALNLRTLYDAQSQRAEEAVNELESEVFSRNEAKGLHRNLERVRKGFAQELFEGNRSLYDTEIAKVQSLVKQRAPKENSAKRNTIKDAVNEEKSLLLKVEQREAEILEKTPKMDPVEAYALATRLVRKEMGLT